MAWKLRNRNQKAGATTPKPEPSPSRLATVLVPVLVGGLLGLFASLATTAYTTWLAGKETVRKERVSHLERAMTLCTKYSNEIGRAISVGLLTKGNVDAQALDVLTAPTGTLQELSVVIALYLPALQGELQELFGAHNTLMQRYDQIIDARGQHTQENEAAFARRMQAEVAPVRKRVEILTQKIAELAQADGR